MNQKRNEINKQISKIISHDKNGLKKHVDDVKKKISEVLKLFKESLEEKTAKRIKELEDSVEALNKQLKAALRNVHQAKFEPRALTKMQSILKKHNAKLLKKRLPL